MSSTREFDLVIFGATGFTGFFIVRELVQTIDEKRDQYGDIKWAIAGRTKSKLIDVLQKVGNELGKDLSETIATIVADVTDIDSIRSMAERTRLVINAVGPFRFFGEPVVEVCVAAGTHHIDISGEPQYIETVQVNLHAKALENEVLVVSTCGWDSIPCDLGVDFLKRHFDGRLHSVETFMMTKTGPEGYKINFGTLQSAIYGFAHSNELGNIRRRLYSEVLTKKLPPSRIRLERAKLPFTRSEIPGWHMEFPGADRSVVQRTQYYNYEHFSETPIQIQTYFTVPGIVYVFGTILMAGVFALLSMCGAGRRLLERYPEPLTFGKFSKNGPTRAQIESTRFSLHLIGKGWSKQRIADKSDTDVSAEPAEKFDKMVHICVNGCDPGYKATAVCIVQSGLTILKDRSKMPKGGVLTPASAFRDTDLLKRLETSSNGMTFEVVSS